jgi:tetratricopeptide (TPR) repeat protein
MPFTETLDLTAPRRREKSHRYRRRQLWSLRPGRQALPLELVSVKCGVLMILGNYEDAKNILSAMVPKAEALGDRRWSASMAADLAHALSVLGEAGAALPHAERAKMLFTEAGDQAGLARTIYTLSGIYSDLAQPDRAHQLSRELLELAERTGQSDIAVQVIYDLRQDMGPELALERMKGLLDAFRLDGDKSLIAKTCFFMGDIYLSTGRWAEAEACNAELYRLAAETGNRMGMSFAIGDRGLILYGQGRYREAIDCYLEKLEIAESMGDFYNVYEALDNIGVAYQELGDLSRALEYFKRAEAHTRRHNNLHYLCKSLFLMAKCLLESDQSRRAAEANTEALEIARDIGYPYVLFHGALLEARLEAAIDRNKGLESMYRLAAGAENDEQMAEAYYQIFKLSPSPESRQQALASCRRYYQESKLFDIERRIAELET